eukprot:5132499-Alexandrium_andersonii.AAC.1
MSVIESASGPLCSAVLRHGKLIAGTDTLRGARRRAVRFIDGASVLFAVCTARIADGNGETRALRV